MQLSLDCIRPLAPYHSLRAMAIRTSGSCGHIQLDCSSAGAWNLSVTLWAPIVAGWAPAPVDIIK